MKKIFSAFLGTAIILMVAGVAVAQVGWTSSTVFDLGSNDLTCNQATATVNAIGATQGTQPSTESWAVTLTNTTSTASGATVQVSPSLVWHGSAKNSVSGLSETQDIRSYLLPVTAAGATTAGLIIGQSKNGAAYSELARFQLGIAGPTIQVPAGAGMQMVGATTSNQFTWSSAGEFALSATSTSGAFYIDATALSSGTHTLWRTGSGYAQIMKLDYLGNLTTTNNASFGGGTAISTVTKLTTNATVFHIWTAAALSAESCVNVRAACSVIDKAATASRNSYDKETLCCNAAGTTTCDAITAIREVEVEAAWDMTILPCDEVAGSCLTADAPVVAITGEAAHNLNWKCSVNSYVLTNG